MVDALPIQSTEVVSYSFAISVIFAFCALVSPFQMRALTVTTGSPVVAASPTRPSPWGRDTWLTESGYRPIVASSVSSLLRASVR